MNKHDTLDEAINRFNERIEAKKAAAPKLHDFTAEFRIGLKAKDEETAQETVNIIGKMLTQFEDITSAEGKLK